MHNHHTSKEKHDLLTVISPEAFDPHSSGSQYPVLLSCTIQPCPTILAATVVFPHEHTTDMRKKPKKP